MSFNQVLQLIDNGLQPEEIISYMGKASPKLSKKIQQMMLGGYGSGEIVNFLARDKEVQKKPIKFSKPSSPYEIANMAILQNEMEVPKGRDKAALDDLKKFTSAGLGLAATVAPFYMKGPMAAIGAEMGLGKAKELLKTEEKPGEQKSLFRRLAGDIDVTQLDEQATKELSFLEKIASQLEAKGKTEKDPQVKKLKKKIDKALQGITGMIEGEAMAMGTKGQELGMQEPQQQPVQAPLQPQGQAPQGMGPGQQALMASMQEALKLLGQ